jgi:hypothetical protein
MVDPQVTNTQTTSTSTTTNGSGDAVAKNMAWLDLVKSALAQVIRGGPIVALLGLVLFGAGYLLDKHLTKYFEQNAVLTRSYSEYIEQSKKSDTLLTSSVAGLAEVVALNTKRVDQQDKMLEKIQELIAQNAIKIDTDTEVSRRMLEDGSRPARKTADLMERAMQLMEPTAKFREESARQLTEQTAILRQMLEMKKPSPGS